MGHLQKMFELRSVLGETPTEEMKEHCNAYDA
jgi:hypothetical protein